ncbi:IgaA/UmoB family intracellular growth attenuator [Escherichia coli]
MVKHEHHCDFFSCFAGLLTTCGMADKSAIQTGVSCPGPTPSRMRKRVNSHLKNVAPLKIILRSLTQVLQVPGPTGASAAPISLVLNAESNNVMMLTHAITRYGISTDDPNKWRYYLQFGKIPPAPFWEQYINDENTVELIYTDSLPLVISLNGHTLRVHAGNARLCLATCSVHAGVDWQRVSRSTTQYSQRNA